MSKKFILVFILLLILLIFVFKNRSEKIKESKVCFNERCFLVEVAETSRELNRGLMLRESLAENEGMLFIFEKEGNHPFWMKNTLVALDIIWLDANRVVVFVKENAQPCGNQFCETIDPQKKAKYVLELNAGSVEDMGLKTGNQLIFNSDY